MATNTTYWAIYEFICAYIQREGYSPTYQEIASACNCTEATVGYHVSILAARGLIERIPRRARSLKLVNGCR